MSSSSGAAPSDVTCCSAGTTWIWRWRASHAAPDVTYRTAPVEKKPIVARVTASGTIQATVTVQVGAQVSGRIAKLSADFNSTVKKGEIIAKIDPQLFIASVEQAKLAVLDALAGRIEAEQMKTS